MKDIEQGHKERHRSERASWLRAAVLGSNDAIVSTAGLMLGVASSQADRGAILVAGVSGLVAGAMSMAVGEYISVSSQRDAERADIEKEKKELSQQPELELEELTQIYVRKGLSRALAAEVAQELTAHDSLAAHLHDELGLREAELAHPFQAAWVSALSFACFAALPIAFVLVAPEDVRIVFLLLSSLISLVLLGGLGAYLGGASVRRAAFRVAIGGASAMALAAAVGRVLGVTIG